jgi:hypothetical protein
MAVDIGHYQIGDYQVDIFSREFIEGLLAVTGHYEIFIRESGLFECFFYENACRGGIIDDHYITVFV